jgi:hypothetical protein
MAAGDVELKGEDISPSKDGGLYLKKIDLNN